MAGRTSRNYWWGAIVRMAKAISRSARTRKDAGPQREISRNQSGKSFKTAKDRPGTERNRPKETAPEAAEEGAGDNAVERVRRARARPGEGHAADCSYERKQRAAAQVVTAPEGHRGYSTVRKEN